MRSGKYSLAKTFTVGVLTALMVLVGIVSVPKVAEATEDKVGEIIYSDEYDFSTLYADKVAPVKKDFVFGGWYTKKGDTYEPLTEAGAATAASAYAKFVPAYVLSVKAQNAENTTEEMTGTTSTRIITSVDSKNYQKVGFEIYLGNGGTQLKDDGEALETSRVYAGIKIGTSIKKTATEIFGTASKHVAVWELTDIMRENHNKIICVRPYWKTMDGTTVYGLTKYVHIEDDYKNYISVPVNLMTGETIAAGIMNMTYTAKNASGEEVALTLVEDSNKMFEAGRLLPQMSYNSDKAGQLKMVGHATTVGTEVTADGIYANIRFQKPDEACTVTFTMTSGDFCDWNEKSVDTVKAWDITYAVVPK